MKRMKDGCFILLFEYHFISFLLSVLLCSPFFLGEGSGKEKKKDTRKEKKGRGGGERRSRPRGEKKKK